MEEGQRGESVLFTDHVALSVHFFSIIEPRPQTYFDDEDEWDLSDNKTSENSEDTHEEATSQYPSPSNNSTKLSEYKPESTPTNNTEMIGWTQQKFEKPLQRRASFLSRISPRLEENIEDYYQKPPDSPWKMPVIDKSHKSSTPCLFVPFHDNGGDEPHLQNQKLQKITITISQPARRNTTWTTPQSVKKHRRNISMGDARLSQATESKETAETTTTKSADSLGIPSQNIRRQRSERVITSRCGSPLRRREPSPGKPLPSGPKRNLQSSTTDIMRKVKLNKAKGIIGKYSRATLLFASPFQPSPIHDLSAEPPQISSKLVDSVYSRNDNSMLHCSACELLFSFTVRRHRCRNCTNFFCKECSSHKMKVPHKGYRKKMRVCDRCFTRLSELEAMAETNFLQTHLTLANSYKIVFLGPSGAGKTSFVQRSVCGRCPGNDELLTMLGVATAPLEVTHKSEEKEVKVLFHIWDINGNRRYYSLLDCYCDSVDCCILAFDVGAVAALDDLQNPWIETIQKFDRTNTIVVLLGLKCDRKQRGVTTEEATLFAKTQAMDLYLEASTVDGMELSFVYENIAKLLIERHVRDEVIGSVSPTRKASFQYDEEEFQFSDV